MSSEMYPDRELWKNEYAYRCTNCGETGTRILSSQYSISSNQFGSDPRVIEYCEECDVDGEFPIIEFGGDNSDAILWTESQEFWEEWLDEDDRKNILVARGYTLEEIESQEFKSVPQIKESVREERLQRFREISDNDTKSGGT